MASVKAHKVVINGWLHIAYYCPIKKRGRTKATGLKDNRDGNKLFKIKLEKFLEEQRNTKFSIFPLLRKSEGDKLFSEQYEKYLSLSILKPRTISNKKLAARVLLEYIGDKPISEYVREDFQRLNNCLLERSVVLNVPSKVKGKRRNIKTDRTFSQNTASIRTKDLRAIFQFFVDNEWIDKNFVIRIKELKKKPTALLEKDAIDLLNYISSQKAYARLYEAIYFMLYTGFRADETAKLDWQDVVLPKSSIRSYNKVSGDEELSPLLDNVVERLKKLNPEGGKKGPVFGYKNGNSFSSYDRAQIALWGEHRYTLHQLRKTFITRLLESGIGLDDVKEFSRHSTKSMQIILEHYKEVKQQRLRDEANKKMQDLESEIKEKYECK